MRIGGLASGMDTDTIIKNLMQAQRIPLDKMKQQKQVLEWQRDDYRALNTALLDFRSTLTQMKLTPSYRTRQASSTDESKISVSTTSGASLSSYSISSVKQLATAETIVNGGAVNVDRTKALADQATGITWDQGVVESKAITVANDLSAVTTDPKLISTGISKPKTEELGNWNVKVNGKSFEVVKTEGDLAEGKVYVDSDGNLKFHGNEKITMGSSIRIDYISIEKTDSLYVTKDTKSLQLSRGSINTISKITLKGEGYTKDLTFGTLTDGKFNLELDSVSVGTINASTGKIEFNDDFKSKLPTEIPKDLKLEVTYNQNYTKFTVGAFTSKGQTNENFFVQGNDSLNSVMSYVNNSTVGVSMFYDDFTKQMTLSRTETGDFNKGGNEITLSSPFSNDFINNFLKFKFLPDRDSGKVDVDGNPIMEPDPNSAVIKQAGQNLQLDINGLTTERNSNTFEMNGVTFTVKQTFDPEVKVNVNNDGDKMMENIKDFVKKYNDLIGKINGKLSEERFRKYAPLTDDQKSALSDKQQEQWEEKAKSGLLRRDPLLSSALTQMRLDFSSPVKNSNVSNAMSSLAAIGITTTSNYLDGGKLEIDETKLRKAIQDDPQSVENLFRGDGASYSEKGVVQRLYDSVSSSMNQIRDRAGNANTTNKQFAMGKQLDDLNKRISDFDSRMKDLEDRYYRQFSAMERATQKANSQSAYLMNAFGGGK